MPSKKAYGEEEVCSTYPEYWGLDVEWLLASHCGRFTAKEKLSSYPLHRGCVSRLIAGVKCWERTRIHSCRESNHHVSVVQLLAQSLYRLSYPGCRSDDDDNVKTLGTSPSLPGSTFNHSV